MLFDVSEMAWEAGICLPTAVTAAVWERFVRVPKACPWQDETGRLWDILCMLRCAAAANQSSSELQFQMFVQNTPGSPKPVTLKAVCGPGDDGTGVVTVMLPEEGRRLTCGGRIF
jgi:hypothetical protein